MASDQMQFKQVAVASTEGVKEKRTRVVESRSRRRELFIFDLI